MAGELSINVGLSFSKNGANFNRSDSAAVDVAGNFAIYDIISVGTSDESLALGDVGTIGYVYLKNLDDTKFITFGPDGSSYPLKLKAGESCLFRFNGAALHAKADTGACKLEFAIIEN